MRVHIDDSWRVGAPWVKKDIYMKKLSEEWIPGLASGAENVHTEELEETLATTIGHIKSLHSTLSVLMMEVAAIRRTVLGGPEEIALYRDNLKAAQEIANPIVEEAMESFDEMIRKMGGDGWEN
jgi:hypothetical protein